MRAYNQACLMDGHNTISPVQMALWCRHNIKALRLLNGSGYTKRVRNLAVSVYDLIPSTSEQLELFASPTHAVAEAMDKINDRWGKFVITPALIMGMGDIILDRISFGGVKELEEIYFD